MRWLNGADKTVALAAIPEIALATPANPAQPPNAEVARLMPVMDMAQAIGRRQVIVQAMQQLMREGVDYGKIPGSERPTLLQPGADKLCNLFGLVLKYEFAEKVEDWSGVDHAGEPFFYYVVLGRAYRNDFLMGEGIGSCNSWEAKYRWRKAERQCPTCGKENIRKSRDAGWYCWSKTGGCGAVFADDDQRIISQMAGRKPNPDIFDCVNTVQKMGAKRCKVSTTINATSAAEFFTQDIEDIELPDIPTLKQQAGQVETGGNRVGTQAAADFVAQAKVEQMKTSGEITRAFAAIREKLGEVEYLKTLAEFKVSSVDKFRKSEQARECYKRMLAKLREAA
jgi:hypothetical protein